MYTQYYGLAEKPFALLPDPRYLFLGRSHREALAHLMYGIEEGEGFVVVVGQVGTGKTTLCRALMRQVGDEVTIAYIFNPSASDVELLAAINREFAIPTLGCTCDDLIEELNQFLLAERAQGRRVILVIDEAQNLDPDVLERVRLISNLETEREKLIQIVLIGQPELEESLSRADLRQLRQRITVRWNLEPFSRGETSSYLRHRLSVAGARERDLFTPAAIRTLHRRSGGVPRVINALADRALLSGYTTGHRRITASKIRGASRELPTTSQYGVGRVLLIGARAAAALVAAGSVVGLALAVRNEARIEVPRAAEAPPPAAELPAVETAHAVEAAEAPVPAALERALAGSTPERSAAGALSALLGTWGYPSLEFDELDPNLAASAVRSIAPLRVWSTRLTREQLLGIGLPAMLELELASGERRYAALVGTDATGRAELTASGGTYAASRAELDRLWTGRAFVVWTNYESMPALESGMSGSAVRWLQARLTDLGYLQPGDASGEFDLQTSQAIRRFQDARGIETTGEVGPETLIVLYQALRYGAPRLDSETTS
jgi:general secretion pathway protein A